MIAHCASRLGVISYIYTNRHDIAHSLGILAEKPVAFCSSHYYIEKNLTINDKEDYKNPLTITIAQEIVLFCTTSDVLSLECPVLALIKTDSRYLSKVATSHQSDIFHPPATRA